MAICCGKAHCWSYRSAVTLLVSGKCFTKQACIDGLQDCILPGVVYTSSSPERRGRCRTGFGHLLLLAGQLLGGDLLWHAVLTFMEGPTSGVWGEGTTVDWHAGNIFPC